MWLQHKERLFKCQLSFLFPSSSLFVILLHTHTHINTCTLYSLLVVSFALLFVFSSFLSLPLCYPPTHTFTPHSRMGVQVHTHTLFPFLCSLSSFSFCVLSSINPSSLLSLCFSLTYSLHLSHIPIFKLQGSHLMTDMLAWSSFQCIPLSWNPIPLSQRGIQCCDFSDKQNNGLCYAVWLLGLDYRAWFALCLHTSLSLGTQTPCAEQTTGKGYT